MAHLFASPWRIFGVVPVAAGLALKVVFRGPSKQATLLAAEIDAAIREI